MWGDVLLTLACVYAVSSGQEMPSSSPVSNGGFDMSPLHLSWNQVHRMVRDNLIELDDLKREHDAIYGDLLSCYGLEKCLKGFDIDLATSNNVAAGELLAKLQREREQLGVQTNRLDAEMRERQRQMEWQQRQQQQQQQNRPRQRQGQSRYQGGGGGGGGGGGFRMESGGGGGRKSWSSSSSSSNGYNNAATGGNTTYSTKREYSYSSSSSSSNRNRGGGSWSKNNMVGGEEYDGYDDYDYGPQQGRGK